MARTTVNLHSQKVHKTVVLILFHYRTHFRIYSIRGHVHQYIGAKNSQSRNNQMYKGKFTILHTTVLRFQGTDLYAFALPNVVAAL